jgi:pimeloyl-ACP methyl ester carboxylesterase
MSKGKAAKAPVVMIHGAFCGGWAFEKFRTPFEAAGHAVHAPDLRYHDRGKTPPAELGRVGMKDYASDIAALVETLDAPPVLVGHSMGGLLAQMVATRVKVAGLVLLAPCPPWGVLPSTLFEVVSAQAMFFVGDLANKPIVPSYDIAAQNSLDRLPKAERDAVFARFVPESGRATFETMHWGLDPARAVEVPAAQVTCPVLCITGSDDRMNPPGTVRRIASRYRDRATFEESKGQSHWLIGEPGWERVAERAVDWIAQN